MFFTLIILFLPLGLISQFFNFKCQLYKILGYYKKIISLFSSEITDSKKEKMIKIYSLKLLLINVRMGLIILAGCGCFLALDFIVSHIFFNDNLLKYTFTKMGFLSSFISTGIYYFLSKAYERVNL